MRSALCLYLRSRLTTRKVGHPYKHQNYLFRSICKKAKHFLSLSRFLISYIQRQGQCHVHYQAFCGTSFIILPFKICIVSQGHDTNI
jgi:hypothetical protein